MSQKIFTCHVASKLASDSEINALVNGNTKKVTTKKMLPVRKKVCCVVPEKDIHCFVTKSYVTDETTKKYVQQQIYNKMLRKI